jgi:hypothetical protein
LASDSFLSQWSENIIKAAAAAERPVFPTREYKSYLEHAGFEEVVESRRKWPTNSWPRDKKFKELGAWALMNIDRGLEGFSLAHFTRGLGWTQHETVAFCASTRKDLRDKRIHAYWPM